MGIFSLESAHFPSLTRVPRFPVWTAIGGFLLLAAYGVIAAESGKTYTQNQRCTAIASTGAATYDATIDCTFDIVRPSSDASSDVIRVGIFALEALPGVVSWTVPGYTCAEDGSRDGVKRTTCTGSQDAGSTVHASVRVRMTGPCGVQTAIGTQVNQNDVLSEFQNTIITFPACASASAHTSSSLSSSSPSVPVASTQASYQCSDGIDNDGDNLADFYDAGCSGPYDTDESNTISSRSSVSTERSSRARPITARSSQAEVAGYEDRVTIAEGSPNFAGSVTMTKASDRGEARPGDRLWFIITVRNNSPRTLTNLHLTDRFTSGDFTVVDAGKGEVSGSMIEWLNGGLQPYETKTLRYQVKIAHNLSHGYSVENMATLSGGGLSRSLTATTRVGIMREMPPTGFVKLKPLY
jgi:uncharacterized repeat protein (TIGR01451 family)